MVGWGTFFLFIVKEPFARKEAWSLQCIGAGLGAWFVIDTSLSAYSGVYANIILNTVILVLVAIPLISTREDFAASSRS
jgi:hypothetical protein